MEENKQVQNKPNPAQFSSSQKENESQLKKNEIVVTHSAVQQYPENVQQQLVNAHQINDQHMQKAADESKHPVYSHQNAYYTNERHGNCWRPHHQGYQHYSNPYPQYWQMPTQFYPNNHYGFQGHLSNNFFPPHHFNYNQSYGICPEVNCHPQPMMTMTQQSQQKINTNNKNRKFFGHGFRGRRKFMNNCNRKIQQCSSSSKGKKEGKQTKCKAQEKQKNKCQIGKQLDKNQQIQQEQLNSSSESQNQNQQKLVQQIKNISLNDPKQQKIQKKIQLFSQWLQPFFDMYNLNFAARHRSLQYVLKRYQNLQQLNPLLQTLCELQNRCPQYLSSPYFSFFVILKTVIKNNFQIQQIMKKLQKKFKLKDKKQKHDSRFKQKYPNPVQIQFLTEADLLKCNKNKTLFLIDGNNIMSKQKIFRQYFQSANIDEKAQGQIRLAWLFSQSAVHFQLFFDNKYRQELYLDIKQQIMSVKQQQEVNKAKIIYADKHENQANTADMKIAQRLQQITQLKQYEGFQIIVVSADKQLLQICKGIYPQVKQSSGMYIYKYTKQLIRDRYFNHKNKKGIIKRIFSY